MNAKEHLFVFLGNSRFGGLYHRERALARELAGRGYEVKFIEEMPSFASIVQNALRKTLGKTSIEKTDAEERIPETLEVLTPPVIPTFFRSSLVPMIDRKIFRRWFGTSFRNQDWSKTVLIVTLPYWWNGFVDRQLCPAKFIIYDYYDALEMPSRTSRTLAIMENSERRLLNQIDLIAYSANVMKDRVERIFPNGPSVLLPNGISDGFLRSITPKKAKGERVIGYIGSLDPRWADRDLILRVAREYPDTKIVVRASVDRGFAKQLSQHPNVRIAGFTSYENVAKLVSEFTIGIIPFKNNGITEVINPLKFYEYCSAGIPIVSTWTKELSQYEELLYLAHTPDDFISAIKIALEERDEALRLRRQMFAKSNTWKDRVDQLLDRMATLEHHKTF